MAHPDKNKRPSSMRGNAQQRRSARYFKKNKAGDAGGQEKRANVNDDQMIFTDYRKNQRVKAYGGGMSRTPMRKGKEVNNKIMYSMGGEVQKPN